MAGTGRRGGGENSLSLWERVGVRAVPIPQPPSSSTQRRIDALLAEVEERWGRGVLVRWGDTVESDVETVPTGFADLDEALGVGGLPCGRISELFGPDSSGKHALVASIAAQCQKQDGVVVWIDPAGRLDPEQMSVLDVDLGSLLVARPRDESQALEMAVRLARSGGVRLMVFDLPAPRGWGMEDRGWKWPSHPPTPNTQHPSLSLALRRLVAAVHRNHISFLFISEQRTANSEPASERAGKQASKQDARSHGNLPLPKGEGRGEGVPQSPTPNTQHPTQPSVLSPHRSTGGQALRYFASMRLEMERREWIRRGREIVGCRSSVRVVKNKLSAPHREAEVDLLFYRFPPSAPALSPSKLAGHGASERQMPTGRLHVMRGQA